MKNTRGESLADLEESNLAKPKVTRGEVPKCIRLFLCYAK